MTVEHDWPIEVLLQSPWAWILQALLAQLLVSALLPAPQASCWWTFYDFRFVKILWFQICENGILKFRPRSKVAPGYPRAGRGFALKMIISSKFDQHGFGHHHHHNDFDQHDMLCRMCLVWRGPLWWCRNYCKFSFFLISNRRHSNVQIADYDAVCLISNLQDLHRWWFESRCSNKRMRVSPRSWEEVVNDPRFRP